VAQNKDTGSEEVGHEGWLGAMVFVLRATSQAVKQRDM
jgi:hypothetical protein